MTSQNRRSGSKKDLITKIILFSIIIGQAFTKEIGGLIVQNNILKGNPPGQYTGVRSNEDVSKKEIDDEIIGAYDCLDDSTPSTEISLNPPQECRIEDGSAYQKPIKKRAQILEHVRKVPV